jgi:hypothetical protein
VKKISEILGVLIAVWFCDQELAAPTLQVVADTRLHMLELLRPQDDDAREFVARAHPKMQLSRNCPDREDLSLANEK